MTDPVADLRLRQLTSAALPVGAFAYSQGLESAVELGWVQDPAQAQQWIGGLLEHTLSRLEVPLLARLMAAFASADEASAERWSGLLLALRDTAETRINLGRVCQELGQLAEAVEHYQRVLAGETPHAARVQFFLGQALRRLDRFAAARQALERALQLDPTLTAAQDELAHLPAP